MAGEIDWEPIRALGQRVIERGEPLELTDEVRALLQRSAEEVALSPEDAENALRSVPTATALLGEIRRRIREGSAQLGAATIWAYDLRDDGDLDGACRQMEEVLAVEADSLIRSSPIGLSSRSFCIVFSKGTHWNSTRECALSCDGPPLTWA
nr:DUSAM domain-containing protein [Stigmatella erecta]